MDQQTGKYILIAGLIIIIAGILIYFFNDYFKWIGKLPGDFKIEKENFRFYFPLTTMIILSVVATVIINLLKRFF
jgi:H+/Cl- antiporter ClcA